MCRKETKLISIHNYDWMKRRSAFRFIILDILSIAHVFLSSIHLFKEFMLCRDELQDPRQCLKEGREVTNCSFEFFRLMKKTCKAEFTQYANCLDKSSSDMGYKHCRNTQNVFDKCVLDNFNIERPGYGYFCRAQIVDTKRPKPPSPPKPHYEGVPNELPDDAPKPPARYGGRMFLWSVTLSLSYTIEEKHFIIVIQE